MAGTIKFFDEMQNASNVSGQDKMMIGKAENGETQVITFDQAKQYLDITSNEIAPIIGGDSEANATPVPAGPAGQTRRADVAPGWIDFGSGPIEASATNRWMAYWDGSSWSLVDMGELPQTDTSALVSKIDMISDNLFDEANLVPMILSTGNLVQTSADGRSFYIPVKAGDVLMLKRPEALTNRFTYGFTVVEPANLVEVQGVTSTSLTEYNKIVAPIDGYLFVYLSSSADDPDRDFSNITLGKIIEGKDIALRSDVDGIKRQLTSGNLFDESGLVALTLSATNAISSTTEGRSYYYPVRKGDTVSLEREVALTNRFTIGFTRDLPEVGVTVEQVDSSNLTSHKDVIVPFDGYVFIYLSTSSDDPNRDFSNIVFRKTVQVSELALESEVESIKDSLKSGNLFDENGLVPLTLSSTGVITSNENGRGFFIDVKEGDAMDVFRDEALSNRFSLGFTMTEPMPGVEVYDIRSSSTTEYRNVIAPFDGYLYLYLSTSTDDPDRDFSNIRIVMLGGVKVEDSLDSQSTSRALSANQGRILRNLIGESGGLFMFGVFDEIYRSGEMPDLSSTLPDMLHSEIYSMIDASVSGIPGVEKNLLGYGADANNQPDTNAPIYEYVLSPLQAKPEWVAPDRYLVDAPVILLLAGLHGNEKLPPWATAKFIDLLVNSTDDKIASIRNNVTLKIVPVIPWVFDNHSRENINGINLNRDFNSADPQQETIVLKAWMNDNSNALCFTDFHNSYYDQSGVSYCITGSESQAVVFSTLTRRLSPIWKREFLPTELDNFTRGFVQTYPGTGLYGGLAAYYADSTVGIPRSAVLEACKNWEGEGNNWYTQEAVEVNVELLINYILGTLSNLNK